MARFVDSITDMERSLGPEKRLFARKATPGFASPGSALSSPATANAALSVISEDTHPPARGSPVTTASSVPAESGRRDSDLFVSTALPPRRGSDLLGSSAVRRGSDRWGAPRRDSDLVVSANAYGGGSRSMLAVAPSYVTRRWSDEPSSLTASSPKGTARCVPHLPCACTCTGLCSVLVAY